MWLLKTALVGLAVFIAGLIAYILVVSPGRVWVSANEAAAVGKLRDLNDFQRKYAAAHLEKGFACTLSLLKSAEPRNRTDHDMTSTQFGYNFAIINCRLDAKGRVIHYQATAVPIKQGTTGFRAFCTDDSGELWYDRKAPRHNACCHNIPFFRSDRQGLLGSHFPRKIDFGQHLA